MDQTRPLICVLDDEPQFGKALEWGYIGRKFFAQKMRVATGAGPFLAQHLKSLGKKGHETHEQEIKTQ